MSEIKTKKKKDRFGIKNYFNQTNIVENVPFFLYISLLAILYIYNGHYADNLTRKIGKSEINVKELEYEYKTIKSQVIFRSKASELIKVVTPVGLAEVKEPPINISDSSLLKK